MKDCLDETLYEIKFQFNSNHWRVRRSYRDFLNLVSWINKKFPLHKLPELISEDRLNGEEIHALLTKIFKRDYHQKINTIHKFFEISLFNFNDNGSTFLKQMQMAKKTGQKQRRNFSF